MLVGFETSDDAAVYRLSADIALISTADYITPPVDDPYWFGQIAAANALSDVYAMGGTPHTALNLVMFPAKKLDLSLLKEILHGGADKVLEAGACLAGGHSVDDNEPKYGLAVTGSVHPEHILKNTGAKAGDALVLTKPIGTGVLFNANRSGKLPYRELEIILPQIAALNKTVIETALNFEIHACTDITGFGLIGHMLEIASGSGVQIDVIYDRIPFHPNALEMYQKGESTGSNEANRSLSAGFLEMGVRKSASEEELLYDPQTSGGLLLALPDGQADGLVGDLKAKGIDAASKIGVVKTGGQTRIRII